MVSNGSKTVKFGFAMKIIILHAYILGRQRRSKAGRLGFQVRERGWNGRHKKDAR